MTALIQTPDPESATGEVQKGYDTSKKRGIKMPDPLRLISASPGYFSIMMKRNNYYSNHPRLSFSLLAHIRYYAAARLGYGFCTRFNRRLIKKMGVSDLDFQKMEKQPEASLLEPDETAMLLFVICAMNDPESVSHKDIEPLRQAGWQDSDILDALAQGVGMFDHHIFMRVFKPAYD